MILTPQVTPHLPARDDDSEEALRLSAKRRAAVRDLLELVVAKERGVVDERVDARLDEVVTVTMKTQRAPFPDPERVASVALVRELRGLYAAHLAGLLDAPEPGTDGPARRRYPRLYSALRSAVARHLPERIEDDLEWLVLGPAQLDAVVQSDKGRSAPAHKVARWAVAQLVDRSIHLVRSREATGDAIGAARRFNGSFDSGEEHIAVALRALGATVESSLLLATISRLLHPLTEALADDPERQVQLLEAMSRAVADDPRFATGPQDERLRWPGPTALDVSRNFAIAADLLPIDMALRTLLARRRGMCGATAVGDPFHRLDQAEEAVAAGFAPSRREAFVAGRIAIGRALVTAGHSRPVVLADRDGVPVLPDGYVGSIAHKHGRAVAVVAPTDLVPAVGIDLEFDDQQDEAGLAMSVSLPTEAANFDILAADGDVTSPATLVLSAKEAVFKAVFPTLRGRFDFDDLILSFEPGGRRFRAEHFPGSDRLVVVGEYALAGRWILSMAIASPVGGAV